MRLSFHLVPWLFIPSWACGLGGFHGTSRLQGSKDQGPSLLEPLHQPAPPKSSDHSEFQHFLFLKSLSPNKERKLLSAGFVWKKRVSGSRRKTLPKRKYFNKSVKREDFFFILLLCFLLKLICSKS